MIEFPLTPITEETFERQNWEMNVESEHGEEYYYFTLPLPRDNPNIFSISTKKCPFFIFKSA
jgi:hypothetical protein